MAAMKKAAKGLPEGICASRLNTFIGDGRSFPAEAAATAAMTAA